MSGQRTDWRKFRQEGIKTANRRAGGWRAKKAGESAEELLIKVGEFYLMHGLAELRKRPEPYRRIGAAKSNGQFTAAPLSKSGPDFDLALPDGRSGLIEVKSRKGHRVPLSAVGEVQDRALKRRIDWRGFGVILVMLWREGEASRWWAIDWRRWNEAKIKGYKSLSADDLDQLAIRCRMLSGQRPDWLPALLSTHEQASECLWPEGVKKMRKRRKTKEKMSTVFLESSRSREVKTDLETEEEQKQQERAGLAYTQTGTPNGPEVWILHGILGSRKNWAHFTRSLHQAYPQLSLVSIDLRCHGDSAHLTGVHSIKSCVQDLHLLAQSRGAPACVIGHSFGGKVALQYGASQILNTTQMIWTLDSPLDAHPQNPSTSHPQTGQSEVRRLIKTCQEIAMPLVSREALIELFLENHFSLGVAKWMTTNLKRAPQGASQEGFVWRFNLQGVIDLIEDYWRVDGWGLISEIPKTTQLYLLRAERGTRWSTEAIQRLATIAPHAHSPVLLDSGHWVHIDQLESLIEELKPLNDLR